MSMIANVWFAGQLVVWFVGSRADTAATLYTDTGDISDTGEISLFETCQLTDTWDLGFVRVRRPLVTFGGGDGGTMRGNSKLQ